MKQKFIRSDNAHDFGASLNKALNDGWRVVPGTHAAAITNAGIGEDEYIAAYYGIVVKQEDEGDVDLGAMASARYNGIVDALHAEGYDSQTIYAKLVKDYDCSPGCAQGLCSLEDEDVPKL